jgi:hypothetical protein
MLPLSCAALVISGSVTLEGVWLPLAIKPFSGTDVPNLTKAFPADAILDIRYEIFVCWDCLESAFIYYFLSRQNAGPWKN